MASVTLLLSSVQPVETAEVVEAVAARLRASAPFMEHVEWRRAPSLPGGTLHVHRVDLDVAGEDGRSESEAVPLYALLREMAPVGATGAAESPNGLVTVRLQLQLSLDPRGVSTPDRVLGRGHVLAWRALEGQMLDASEHEGRFVSTAPVTRTDRPSPARADGRGRLYSSAYFSAPVRPVPLP